MLHLVLLALVMGSIRSECDCNLQGSIGKTRTCLKDNECACKPSVVQELQSSCSVCYPQFYNLSALNVFGCLRCSCDVGGSVSQVCNEITGECECKEGVSGKDCDRPDDGTYVPALYHLKGNVVLGQSVSGLKGEDGAKIKGVIEPKDMIDVPPRFKLLFEEYPAPVSFSTKWKQAPAENKKKGKKKKSSRSKRKKKKSARSSLPSLDTKPIKSRKFKKHRFKRQEKVGYKTRLEFPKSGTYFLAMKYTAETESEVLITVDTVQIPTVLPSCEECLIMVAGSLGVKGLEVAEPGVQTINIVSPSQLTIDYIVALPKQYYFTSALKRDVSARCDTGPFSQLCNWYKYPVNLPDYQVEEAESWLSPASTPANTHMTGVNLFGIAANNQFQDGNKPTNQLKLKVLLKEGTRYYIVVNYYKPYQYTNYGGSYTVDITVQSGRGVRQPGKLDFIPCPWLNGCRTVGTNEERMLKLFDVSEAFTKVTISIEENFMIFIESVMFIEDTLWNMDLIQPQHYCVQGPDGQCLQSDFIDLTDYVFYESESAIDAKKVELEDTFYHGTGVMLLDKYTPSLSLVLLENTILSSEREDYVLIVHYSKYTAGHTAGLVNIYDQNNSEGDVVYKFCPSASGCRVAATVSGGILQGVVSHNPSLTGYYSALPVTGGNVHIIVRLSLSQSDSVYIDFLSLVPLREFTVDMLYPLPLDHGPIFTQYCAYYHLYLNPQPNMVEYCKSVVFTMSTLFYNKTLSCGCSRAGSQSSTCDSLTQECRCKPGYAGSTCHQCQDGYYGYPDCQECLCDEVNSYSNTCDKETGQCSCAPNFGGKTCTECEAGRYGYAVTYATGAVHSKLSCGEVCDCDKLGAVNATCHPTTGKCRCKELVAGRRCDICAASYHRFPACYQCQCSAQGTADNQCSVTGVCSCKEGYAGEWCEGCSDYYFYNGTECVPCTCSSITATCTAAKFYPYQVSDDMSGGFEGYTMTDKTGTAFASNRLSIIRFENADKEALMIDLSRLGDHNTYLRLPQKFMGMKSGDKSQTFRYNMDVVTNGQQVTVVSDTIFQGVDATMRYRYESYIVGTRTTVEIEIPLFVYVPFHSTSRWSVVGSDVPPSDREIQRVLAHLVDIRIQTKAFDAQIVAMIDNIKMDYLSTTANSEQSVHKPVCNCGIGYGGNECEYCDGRYYRNGTTDKCDMPCQCENAAEYCAEDGSCQECRGKIRGDVCQECAVGYYLAGDVCLPCRCSLGDTRVISCTEVDKRVTCSECETGYAGPRCQMCDNGYYGDPVFNKPCVKCPCNDNLNLTVPDACDHFTGRCAVCIDSVDGVACERCAGGYYGNPLTDTCRSCDCFPAGSVTDQCDGSGKCRCKGDVVGDKCDECLPGKYVKKHRCGSCECSAFTSRSGVCDMRTGQCDCDTGYGGQRCDGCDTGFYLDPVTYRCQECGCSERGTLNGTCNTYGTCDCKAGYYGAECTECSGYYVNNNDGTCQVCGDCPLVILEQIQAINTTLDLQKGQAVISDYQSKFDNLINRAKDIQDSLPDIPDSTPLLALAEQVQDTTESNAARVEGLIPRSQELFADVGDAERRVQQLPAQVADLKEDLTDLIDNIKNFNLSPASEDENALSKAKSLIADMKLDDPVHIQGNATTVHTYAQVVRDTAADRLPPTASLQQQIPDTAPIPQRLDQIQLHLDQLPLVNVTLTVNNLVPVLDNIKASEAGAADTALRAGDKVAQLAASLPLLQDYNHKSQTLLDNLLVPDLRPLKSLVKEQTATVVELTPKVKPKLFDCSALQPKNLTSDDPGPRFIKELTESQESLQKLRALVSAGKGAADRADGEAADYDEAVQETKDLEGAMKSSSAGAESDVAALETAVGGVGVEQQRSWNKGNRTRLDRLELPTVPTRDVGDVPDAVLRTPDVDPLDQRIKNLNSVPELFDVDTVLPTLLNETQAALQYKERTVEEFNSIDYKLRSLRDKIEKAKRSVETILIPMRFTGQDSYAKYPNKEVEKSPYLSVSATFKAEESKATGGIVYLGPDKSNKREVAGDYIEIGVVSGAVVCNVNIDDNVVEIISEGDIVQPNSWNTISFIRKGGFVSLRVNETETTREVYTTSTLNVNNLVIGRSKTHLSLKGSVTDVYINNDHVSQWLTGEVAGVNKSVRANRKIILDKDIYYFNGDTSYLAYKTPNIDPDLRSASMSIRTASKDGLLMFYADGEGQDLDLFAIDLHEGDLRFHYSSNGKLVTEHVSPQGKEFADLSIVKISTYITSKSGGRMGLTTPRGNVKGKAQQPLNLKRQQQSSYIGKVPDELFEKYASLFEEDSISSKPFIGCISDIKLNKQFAPSLQTARNVKNGCSPKLVSSVSIQGAGEVTLRHTLLGDVSLIVATAAQEGSLLYAGNSEEEMLWVRLVEGKLRVELVQGGGTYTVSSTAAINTSSKRVVRVVTSLNDRLSLYIDDVLEDRVSLDTPLFALSSDKYIYLGLLPDGLPVPTATTGYTGCINHLVIRDKIIDFAFDAVDKSNVILDRCRVIKEVEGPSEGPSEVIAMLQAAQCSVLQTNTVPNSLYFTSTTQNMNHVQLRVRSNSIAMIFTVSLKLATRSQTGGLMFMTTTDSKTIMLTFDANGVGLAVNFGTVNQQLRVYIPVKVNDGYTHQLTVARKVNKFTVTVDGRSESDSLPAGVVTVFMLKDYIYIGGVPESIYSTQAGFDKEFSGCISSIELGDKLFDTSSSAVRVVGSVPRCAESKMSASSHYFNGSVHLIPDASVGSKDQVEIRFRSSRQTGDIMSLLDPDATIVLKLSLDNDKLLVWTAATQAVIPVGDRMYFCDGSYHVIYLRRDGTQVSIQVDESRSVTAPVPDGNLRPLLGDQFTGCMKSPLVNGVEMSVTSPLLNSGVQFNSCPDQSF